MEDFNFGSHEKKKFMSSLATVYGLDSKKPALVLVHGLGSAGTIWKTLIPELVLDFSVYVIDLARSWRKHHWMPILIFKNPKIACFMT